MANLPETSNYDAGVYQLETTDPVVGGASGVSNTPLKNLANRTKYLKGQVDALASLSAGLAPIASPTFTGNPAAPTPALGDNDTSLATTAFVQSTVGGYLSKAVGGGSNVTLTAIDAGRELIELTGVLTANIQVIVPTSPTRAWTFKNSTSGAYTITVKTSGGTGIVVTQGKAAALWTDGTNVYNLTDYGSVALTGTPTAPTAAGGTNTTQIATTAFVATALANLIDSSPAALDTLNELAAALGDDPNFATTMTNTLAGKQPLDTDLTAIAALTSAADKLPYATGVETWALATLTAFARTLLDDADAATMRATLGAAGLSVAQSFTSKQTFGSTVKLDEVLERVTITASAPTTNFDCLTQAIQYFTSNATANWTQNFRGDGTPTTLNSQLAIGESITVTVLATQSTTGYLPTTIQVDGTTTGVSTKYLGGTAWTADASCINAFTFTIIKTADATFTVLASKSKYA